MTRPSYIAPVPDRQPVPSSRVRLSDWQRLEVETARQLAMEAPGAPAELLGPPRTAYLAGRLEGALLNVLDVLDAITTTDEET